MKISTISLPNILKSNNILLAAFLIALGVSLRVLPLLITGTLGNNFAPVAAIALFAGVYFDKKVAIWLPLIVMAASDIFLGFHNLICLTWGCYIVIAFMGMWLRSHKNIPNTVLITVSGSLLFFFVTNCGVWALTPLYAKNLQGLVECYVMAIPFFRNTLLSDLFFVGVLFGAYEFAKYFALRQGLIKVKS